MSQFLDRIKEMAKGSSGTPAKLEPARIVRLVLAAVLLAVALIVKVPALVRVVLLVLSAAIAGYDVLFAAIDSVLKKDYFAAPVIVTFVTLIAFVIGFAGEGAATILLYQIGLLVLGYVQKRTKKSALELLQGQDEEIVNHVRDLTEEEGAANTELEAAVSHSASIVLKIMILAAVIYAIVLPFTGYSFRSSIHRALMMIAVCTPLSVVVAMPLTALVGQCFAARGGVVFNKASNMEDAAHAETAVFDMAGIFSEEAPRLLDVRSDMLDKSTLMNFLAHAVYYSEQPLAKAITDAYDEEYRLDVISDFSEIPGSGVEVKIAGNQVLLAKADYLASRGVRVPQEQEQGQVFYLVIAGRYVGKVILSASSIEAVKDMADAMRDVGLKRCVLFTETGAEESQKIAEALKFDEVYGECDTERKLKLLSDMSEGSDSGLMYVYTTGIETHSAADVDLRVSRSSKFADAVIQPEDAANLPFALKVCKRSLAVASENAIFAFVVKALLIFLAITGKCTIWFALFLDMAAAIATQLNAIRVTSNSLFSGMRRSE